MLKKYCINVLQIMLLYHVEKKRKNGIPASAHRPPAKREKKTAASLQGACLAKLRKKEESSQQPHTLHACT